MSEQSRRRRFAGADDFASAVGTVLGVSSWIKVTQDRVNLFADATEDHQWIHVDVARAAQGPFQSTIAHGYLTLSLIPAFLAEAYVLDGVSSVLNYGLDSVRFPHPVPVGSRLRGTVSLERSDRIASGLRVRLSVVVEIDGIAKPACVAQVVHVLVDSRPGVDS